MNDIEQFCIKNNACAACREWALANCASMAEVWDKAKPEWLIWVATLPGVLDDITLRLYACRCVRYTPLSDGRTVWDMLTDERSRNAVVVSERYARGEASLTELEAARAAAWAWETWAAYMRNYVPNPFTKQGSGNDE